MADPRCFGRLARAAPLVLELVSISARANVVRSPHQTDRPFINEEITALSQQAEQLSLTQPLTEKTVQGMRLREFLNSRGTARLYYAAALAGGDFEPLSSDLTGTRSTAAAWSLYCVLEWLHCCTCLTSFAPVFGAHPEVLLQGCKGLRWQKTRTLRALCG